MGSQDKSCDQWPHREQQVQQLRVLLDLPQPPDVLLYGPTCTGKTSIVRHVLSGRPHAYVSCFKGLKLRCLLSSVVAQLTQAGKRKRAQTFAAAPGTEHSLLWELKAACPPDQPCRFLVLDNMQQLLVAADGPLGALLALREQSNVNLSLVMISRQQPAAQGLIGLMPGVALLSCPAYSDTQLVDILAADGCPQSPAAAAAADAGSLAQALVEHQHQLQQMYRVFLTNTLVPQFQRLSRSLPDLKSQAAALWPRYLAGASIQLQHQHENDDEVDTDVDQESRMYSAVSGRLQAALSAFQPATCCVLATAAAAAAEGPSGCSGRVQTHKAASRHGAAGLELCRLSKLLLVAAFLASRNKPSVDKQLFQHNSAGWRGRTGGRRRSVMTSDRQAEAAKAAELRGPHAFSLSRLLTIYSSLLAADVHQDTGSGHSSLASQYSQQQQQSGWRTQRQGVMMQSAGWMGVSRSDVLMAVNTLVASRLLSKACDDILEAPRFSCDASQELIEQLAVDLSIPLTSYLKYV